MAVSVFPTPSSPSVPNWVALQTSALGVTNVTFSGLSGYNKYRCLFLGSVGSAFGGIGARINGDSTGGNYQWGGVQTSLTASAALFGSSASSFQFAAESGGSAAVGIYAEVEIEGCTLTAIKFMRGRGTTSASTATDLIVEGGYNQTGAVTSITILNLQATGAGAMSGALTLFGAN